MEQLDYNFVLIDCPPSLGITTINALAATKEIIIPLENGIFSKIGVNDLIRTITLVKKKFNKDLDVLGVLFNKVDDRTTLTQDTFKFLAENFKNRLFNTVIHQSVKVGKAQSQQKPVSYYDPACRATLEFEELAREVLAYEEK